MAGHGNWNHGYGSGYSGKRKADDSYGGQEKYYRRKWGSQSYGGGYMGCGGYGLERKQEMRMQIAELESELQYEKPYPPPLESLGGPWNRRPGGMNGGWKGWNRPQRDDTFRQSGGRRREGRRDISSRNGRTSWRQEDEEDDPYYDSCGRGVRIQRKQDQKPGTSEHRYKGKDRGKDKRDRMNSSIIPSKETLQKLMTFMVNFPDKDDSITTINEGVKASGIDLGLSYKAPYLYLEGLIIGHSLQKPLRLSTYRDGLTCLRRSTVDEVFARNEQLVKNEERMFLHTVLSCPIVYSEKTFEERIRLLADEMKNCDRVNMTLNVFATKFCLSLVHVIFKVKQEEGGEEELFDSRLYAGGLFLANATGRTTNYVTYQMYINVKKMFQEKTPEEILKHEKSFEEDIKTNTLESIVYRGCGKTEESNELQVKAYQQKHPPAGPVSIEDLILIDKDAWNNSPFEMLEEGCRRCGMVMKWNFDYIDPKKVKIGEYKVHKNKNPEDPMLCKWYTQLSKALVNAKNFKDNLFLCSIEIEGSLIGHGFGTTRKDSIRSASLKALSSLVKTQTMVKFSNKRIYGDMKDIQFEELKEEAVKLREEMPEPPDFSDFFMEGYEDYYLDYRINSDSDNKVGEGKEGTSDSKVEDKSKETNPFAAEDEYFAKDKEEIDELGPWLKEVIKRRMESFIVDPAWFSAMVFSTRQPEVVRRFIRCCCFKYRLFTIRGRTEKVTRTVIQRNNPDYTLRQIAGLLVDSEDHYKDGYTLLQMRQPDGTVKKYQDFVPCDRRSRPY